MGFLEDSDNCDVEQKLHLIIFELSDIKKKLANISDDSKVTINTEKAGYETEYLIAFRLLLETTRVYFDHVRSLLCLYPLVKPEEHKFAYDITMATLKDAKSLADSVIKRIQVTCSVVENQAALLQLDKAKDIMRSTLPLYDRAIQILEAKEKTK